MTENEILIVQLSAIIPQDKTEELREQIKKQIKEKIVVLPFYAAATTVPGDVAIKFEKDEIVEELEKINGELTRNLCKGFDCSCCPFDIGSCAIQDMINSHIDKLKGEGK